MPRRPTTTIRTYRAGQVGKEKVPNLVIRAEHEAPEIQSRESLDAARRTHQQQGEAIAEALFQHLPGDTVDQILVRLLDRTASLLTVPHRRKR